MGCKVNGAIQIYSGKGTLSDANGVYYSNYSSYISLLCSRKEGVNGELVQLIVYKPVSVDNNYAFSSETSEHYAVYSLSTPSLTGDYYTGSGWVKFARLDEHIAAGTFEFTAYRGDDSVVITEGRFDISE